MTEQTITANLVGSAAPAGSGAPAGLVTTTAPDVPPTRPPEGSALGPVPRHGTVQPAEYRTQEIAAVRAEVAEAVKEMSSVERAAAIAIGGVYAWLATQSSIPIRGAWWIPVLFALVGSLRAYALGVTVAAGRGYLKRHAAQELGGEVGWDETYRREAYSPFRTSSVLVWISFIAITLLVGLVKGAA